MNAAANAMAEYLQLIAYALDATEALISAAKKIAGAQRTLQEIVDRATHVKVFLRITRTVLLDLEKHYKSIIPEEEHDSLIHLIKSDVESCETALSNNFALRDKTGKLKSVVSISDRLLVAAKDARIRKDRDNLESQEERLHRSISVVQTRLDQLLREREPQPDYARGHDCQGELHGSSSLEMTGEQRIRGWRPDFENDDSPIEEGPEKAILSSIRGSLGRSIGSSDDLTDHPIPAASTSDLVSRRGSWSKFSSSKRPSAQTEDPLLEERRHNEAREAGIETLDALDETIFGAWNAARDFITQERWNQAVTALSEVIDCSERREYYYGVQFESRFQAYEEFAIVYLRQGKWSEALKQIPQLNWQSNEDGHSEPSADELLLKSRSQQLCAVIHYDRYTKLTHDLNGQQTSKSETEKDIEEAKECALAAFRILEDIRRIDLNQPGATSQYAQCLLLLVPIYEILDKPYRAAYYRQTLRNLPSHQEGPITRVESMVGSVNQDNDQQDLKLSTLDGDSASNTMFALVRNSDEDSLIRLVNGSDKLPDLDSKDGSNRSLLHYAVENGDSGIVHFLLQRDADATSVDDNQETPLLICVRKGYRGIAEDLIAHGAKADAVHEDGRTILHHAIRRPSTDMTDFVLSIAPQLGNTPDEGGKTPLHHCAERAGDNHMLEQAEMLLTHKHKVDVNAPIAPEGSPLRTPLYLVGNRSYTQLRAKMVELLLANGAQLDEKNPPARWRDYVSVLAYSRKRPTRK